MDNGTFGGLYYVMYAWKIVEIFLLVLKIDNVEKMHLRLRLCLNGEHVIHKENTYQHVPNLGAS